MGIPPILLRSKSNAEVLTKQEHIEKHRNKLSDEEYEILAQSILGWIGNLF